MGHHKLFLNCMTILVTGSAGHLGEALMRTLRAAGKTVLGVDIKASEFTDHVGSISDRDFVESCMDGVNVVLHAATLHKPHVETHTNEEFVDTNITGTLVLLETALAEDVKSFIFTSTTSAFGSALTPAKGEPAAWITEDVAPIPRNIYGTTKVAAESLCELFHRQHGLPVLVLRTSRFFPENDDNPTIRDHYSRDNSQANELLYRRVDIEDVVTAHVLAIGKAPQIGFGRYIISATPPFSKEHLGELRRNAPVVVEWLYPEFKELYAAREWKMFPEFDRVYVNRRAVEELGWRPKYDFQHVLNSLRAGVDFRSELTHEVGSKGYHDESVHDPAAYRKIPATKS